MYYKKGIYKEKDLNTFVNARFITEDDKKEIMELELSSQMQRYIKINFKRRFPVQAFAWTLI